LLILCYYFFFFSSRRRHTRSDRDWSSDVCSSDLNDTNQVADHGLRREEQLMAVIFAAEAVVGDLICIIADPKPSVVANVLSRLRSEERRVGKEFRSWLVSDDCRKINIVFIVVDEL